MARRRGARIALTYAEWLLNGPASPLFKQLCEETGAHLLVGLASARGSGTAAGT